MAYHGVFPIAPTTFDARGDLDLDSQRRAIDFLVDAGVDGICILANYSEQFVLTDAERSRAAQAAGAAMVMLMPPYHGATLRADDAGVTEFFATVADGLDIPIMIQDAPMSGTTLPASLLAHLAMTFPPIQYAKIEVAGAASKLRELIRLAGDALSGPFDGEEGITLLADLDAGATGTMPSAMIPELLGQIVALHRGGQRDAAVARYGQVLPLVNYENRQCGLRATKALMREGGIIASEATRHPFPPLSAATRAGLLELARPLDPLILRWAR